MLKGITGVWIKADFSKPGNTQRLTGLINENGLHRILVASDSDAKDNVSPFLGGLVDSMYGLFVAVETTKTLTEYVDMVKFLCKRQSRFEGTKK